MNVLFLDDSDSRWESFSEIVKNSVRVATAADCISLIKENPNIDWLFLDHDLGGEYWVDSSREDCGMEVVRFLCSNDYTKSIRNIVVHSHNVSAAEEMFNKLKENNYSVRLVPFKNLIEVIKLQESNVINNK